MKVGERTRKQRSDKKRDIKSTISMDLKHSIFRLGYITKTPAKDIAEKLLINAVSGNEKIVEELSKKFQSGIFWGGKYLNGHLDNEKVLKREDIESDRISIRVKSDLYSQLHGLAYACECSVSRVTAILLFESITDTEFIENYVEEYVEGLDDYRKKELRVFLKFIRSQTHSKFSIAAILSYLVEEPLRWLFPDD